MLSFEDLWHLIDKAAAKFGVTIELHGGVLFRLLLRSSNQTLTDRTPVSLFDITPFTSDIDLRHSGTVDQSAALTHWLRENVPVADCFRWEIRSHSEVKRFAANDLFGNIIPARKLVISTNLATGIGDPYDGLSDIQNRQFRYHRNPNFFRSALYADGRDLEVLSAILYIQTLLEADVAADTMPKQPGYVHARTVFQSSINADVFMRLQEYSYLRTRLRYLLCNAIAAAPAQSFWTIAKGIGLADFVHMAKTEVPGLFGQSFAGLLIDYQASGNAPFSAPSSHLGGDMFRLPMTSAAWSVVGAQDIATKLNITMCPGQRIVMASPILPLSPGISGSSRMPDNTPHEFVHFNIPAKSIPGFDSAVLPALDENLSALIAFGKGNDFWAKALPCIVTRVTTLDAPEQVDRFLLRMNCYNLLAAAVAIEAKSVQFFMVAWDGLEL